MTKITPLPKEDLEEQQQQKTPWIFELNIREAFYSLVPHLKVSIKYRCRSKVKKK